MRISLNLIGLLYIIVIGGMCHIFDISITIKAILALPSLLIIPYLVGKTLSLLLKRSQYIEFNFDVISNFIINWSIGLIFIVSTAYLLNYLWLFDAKIFVLLVIILMIPAAFYKEEYENISDFINNYGGKISILLSILIGLIMSLFILNFSPYPCTFGVDALKFNDWSVQLINYNFFIFLKSKSLITLPILSSIPILIFNLGIESYKLWWSTRFILYPLYSFGLYIFSYKISKIKSLSLITAFIGTFIVYHGEAFMFLYHTAPKTIIFLLFPLFLYLVHKIIIEKLKIAEVENKRFILLFTLISLFFITEFIILMFNLKIADLIGVILFLFLIIYLIIGKYLRKNERLIFFLTICIFTTLLLFHTANGFFAAFFILLYLSTTFLLKKQLEVSRYLIYSVVIFSLLFFILQMEGIIEFKEPLIDIYGSKTPFGFETKWSMINSIYHTNILVLFFMGTVFALFYNKDKFISLIFLVSIMFLILISPIKDMYRMLIYLNPFIAFFCAYSLIKGYSIIFSFKNKAIKNIKPIFICLLITVVIILPVVNCIEEINKITSIKYTEGYFTAFAPSQIIVSNYIKSNISKNSIIFHTTTFPKYASYLSMRYPDELMDLKNESVNDELFLDVFLTENARGSYEKINVLVNNKSFTCYNYSFRPDRCKQQPIDNLSSIVIVDWATENWIRKYTNKSIGDIMNKFYNTTYFTLLYKEKKYGICIFGVNPEPGVPFELVNNSKF